MSRLRLAARLENLQSFMQLAASFATELGFKQKRIREIELAVEEAIVNICNYAYQNGEGDVEMICRDEGGLFIIAIEDYGKPFNILTLPEPDVTADIMERNIRGLGVFLINKFMDDVDYCREADKNRLSLILCRPVSNKL
jgi:anti-sigma regulatory factor (Ser/Thr protein kinase)